MVRNDPIPDNTCKFYVFATNKVVTRMHKDQGYKGKAIDVWCADTSAQAQDAVKTLQYNKNYSNPDYSKGKPQIPKTASVALTADFKPKFVFGSAEHQKRMEGIKDYTAEEARVRRLKQLQWLKQRGHQVNQGYLEGYSAAELKEYGLA